MGPTFSDFEFTDSGSGPTFSNFEFAGEQPDWKRKAEEAPGITWDSVKQFAQNAWNDVSDSTANFVQNVGDSWNEYVAADRNLQNNSHYESTAFGDVMVPDSKEAVHEYSEATNRLAESVKTPIMAAGLVSGVGAAMAVPYMAVDAQESYSQGGIGQVARDFTYGAPVDFLSQDDLGEQFYERPFSTAVDGTMSVAPVAIPLIHGARATNLGESIRQTFKDGYDGVKERWNEIKEAGEEGRASDYSTDGVRFSDFETYDPYEMKETAVDSGTTHMADDAYGAEGGYDAADVLLNKIVAQESGGDYTARNPDSGAYGNIQWMPETWAAESKRAFGEVVEMTKENQDTVARAYIHRLLEKYEGDEAAVASAIFAGEGYGDSYHAGKPLYDPNTRFNGSGYLDPNGQYPSINEYINSVLSRDGGTATRPMQPTQQRMEAMDMQKTPQEPLFRQQEVDFSTDTGVDSYSVDGRIEKRIAVDEGLQKEKVVSYLESNNDWYERAAKYDVNEYERIKELPEGEKKAQAEQHIRELRDGVKDPLGNQVRVVFDEANHRAIDGAVNHFVKGSGQGKLGADINARRAFATSLIKDTVSNPLAIVRRNGRRNYVSFYKGPKDMLHKVVVSLGEKNDVGKIITSVIKADNNERKSNARTAFIKEIKKADVIEHISFKESRPTEYPRLPSGARDLSTDTSQFPSAHSIIPNESEMNNKAVNISAIDGEKSYMADGATVGDRLISPNVSVPETAVSRKDILAAINDMFGIQAKKGRVGRSGVLGWYNPNTDVIRTREYGNPRVLTHELGHYIDNHYGFSGSPMFDAEFSNVVHRRFGTAYDKGGIELLRKEGYAEFFHDYTTNRRTARAEFPLFTKQFEAVLSGDKELKGAVDKLSSIAHKWYQQEPWERAKGHISFGEDTGIVSMAKKIVANPKDMFKKAFDKVYTDFVDELHPLKVMEREIEAITGEKIRPGESAYEQAWLARGWVGKAQALLEYGAPDVGVKAFKDIVGTIPKEELQDFSAYLVAKRELNIQRWNNAIVAKMQAYAAAYGGTDTVAWKKFGKLAWDGYAKKEGLEPVALTMKDNDAIATAVRGDANPVWSKAHREMIAYQRHLLYMLVKAGMKDKASVAAMMNKYPDYVPFVREFDEAGMNKFMSSKGFVNVADPIKRMKGSDRSIIDPLESIIKNTYMLTHAIERNTVGQKIAALASKKGIGGIVEKVSGGANASDSSFSVIVKGKKVTYNTTPELYEAMKMFNEEGANFVTKLLEPAAKVLRAGAVLSPEFMIRNPGRDMITAGLFSHHGHIPIYDQMKGLALYLKKGDVYRDYMKSGAGNAAMVSLDRTYLRGTLNDIVRRDSFIKKVAKNPLEVLRAFSEASEMMTRLAEFDNARKGYTGITNRLFGSNHRPLANEQAALAARDITIDFARTGRKTKGLNRTIAFFNATIQGVDKFAREFKRDPKGMAVKSALMITLPSVVLWLMNKDDPRYQELPQWEKDLFWIVPGKDALVRIPKPFEPGVLFGAGVERMLQHAYDKERGRNGVGFKGYLDAVKDALLPNILPTAILPVMEAMMNYSTFLDRNIVPVDKEKLSPENQYGPNTSLVARELGKATGYSPFKIDHLIAGYGGGLGRTVTQGIDALEGLDTSRPAKRWNEMPVIKGITETPYKSSESVQQVYDAFNEQERLYNDSKLERRRVEGYDAAKHTRLKDTMNAMREINKARRIITNSERITGDEKRQKLDKLQMQQINIARRALGLERIR